MSEKLAWIEKEKRQPDDQCNLMLRNSEIVHGTYIKSKDHAIAVITALLQHYNITADELPCLWLSPDKAVDMQDYLIKWDSEDSPATCTFTGEWAAHVDDGCYENPDHIMPIPPLQGEESE